MCSGVFHKNPHSVLGEGCTPGLCTTNLKNLKLLTMENKSFKATITRIMDEVKTKSNGKQFMTAFVKFSDGPLAGKEYFAQRTLGEGKTEIKVGQDVRCMLSVVDDNGTKRPFFEISTSQVDSAEDILAALGL